MSLIREPDAALARAAPARHAERLHQARAQERKHSHTSDARIKMSWMQSNQPHAGISLRREKTKLQSGTETVLISGGDRDGGKSEEAEQACTLSHTHTVTPLGNVWVLQRGNPCNRRKTGAKRALTRTRTGP